MTKSHKSSADSFIRISSCISQMGTSEYMDIDRFLNKVFCRPPVPIFTKLSRQGKRQMTFPFIDFDVTMGTNL